MKQYQLLETEEGKPLLISFGELGTCQLVSRKTDKQLFVLKMTLTQQAKREILCLTKLKHPNIIQIVDYFQHDDATLLIFQFFQNGDLYTKIKCKEIKPTHIPKIFKDVTEAVGFIHAQNVIHRNLKAQNIMINSAMTAKIMDFGLAARLTTRKTVCGCLYYMAPQLLMRRAYSSKVDIWALGVILYEMTFGQVPFEGQSSEEILKSIQKSIIYKIEADEGSLLHLIQMMLNPDPNMRPTPNSILLHPYLRGKREGSLKPYSSKFYSYKTTERKNDEEVNHEVEEPGILMKIKLFFESKVQSLCESLEGEKKLNFSLKAQE